MEPGSSQRCPKGQEAIDKDENKTKETKNSYNKQTSKINQEIPFKHKKTLF